MSDRGGIGDEGDGGVAVCFAGMRLDQDIRGLGGREVGLELVEVGGEIGAGEWDGVGGDDRFVFDAREEGALVVGGDEFAEGVLELFGGCS